MSIFGDITTDPARVAEALTALVNTIESSPDPESLEARVDAFNGTALAFRVCQNELEDAYSKHQLARPAYRRAPDPF